MKLRRIELSGFKSFADKTGIPLPEDLLVVVGPNGSGKSNITDAILWALGEQSAKSLRGNQMRDVIFGGSRRRPPSGTAEVYLLFEVEEGRKVRVGRRLVRNGESSYLMDGRAVRLKDLHDFLMQNAISTHGSFLVEQGRVEALLASGPEERRIVFEEVAGIAHYKQNRRSALQKLDAAQGNLLRLNDIVSEVEDQMNSLKRQAAKADRYVKLSDELRDRRRRFWGRSYALCSGRKSALGRELALLAAERERRVVLLTKSQAEFERAKTRLAEHKSSLQAVVESIHEKELTHERAEQETKRKTDKILAAHQRTRQIDVDIKEVEKRITVSTRDHDHLAKEVLKLEETARETEERAQEARSLLEETQEKTKTLEATREKLRHEAFQLAQDYSKYSAELGRMADDLQRQAARERRMAREEEGLSAREEEFEETIEALLAGKAESERKLAAAVASGEKAKAEADSLAEKFEKAAEALDCARRRSAVAEKGLAVLLASEASLHSSAHRFLKEREPERVAATLAQLLASVPEESAITLAATLGDLLEGYPGQSWEGLPILLSALNSERAGQAIFLLKEFKRGSTPNVKGATGFVSWLHDSPGLPAQLRQAIPLTAVVEDSDAALAFASAYNTPAVSRDGIYVHPEGWIRGGSGGSPGSSLFDFERKKRQAEDEIYSCRSELSAAQALIQETRSSLEGARHTLERQRESEKILAAELEEKKREWEQAVAESRRLSASRELIEGEVAQAREERLEIEARRVEYNVLFTECKKARARVDERAAKSEEAIGEVRAATDSAHEAVAESRTRRGEAAQAIQDAREALKTSSAHLEELLNTEKRLGDERKTLENRVKTLTEEVTRGDQKLRSILLNLEKEKERRIRFEDDLARLAEETGGCEARVKEAQETTGQVREEVALLETELAAAEADTRNLGERIAEVFEESPGELSSEYEGLPSLSEEERAAEQSAMGRIEEKTHKMGAVNMLARTEYKELTERFEFLTKQRKDLEASVESLRETIRKINRTTRDRFMEAFNSVREHFSHLFKEVFEGGEARLSLQDESNPLETGVEIYAQPPGKKLQSLQLLSGGEKAMVALALLFSLFLFRPQPFFILDEVDAPLDEANINRFNRLLKQFRGRTQFIVVSHNKRTMELADVLYGVTMTDGGVSRIVSVKLADVEDKPGLDRDTLELEREP